MLSDKMKHPLSIATIIALLAGAGVAIQQTTTGNDAQSQTTMLVGGKSVPIGFPRINGAFNPSVTQSTINKTICVTGWTKTVRPSVTYTNALKKIQIKQYGYKDTSPSSYEEDHFIPLELGGDPKSPQNLWPEPHTTSGASDSLENSLKRQVCSSTLTLKQGRDKISVWKHTHG